MTIGHGRHVYIERLVIDGSGQITELKGTEDGRPITAVIHPSKAQLAPVTNRGVTYYVPAGWQEPESFASLAGKVEKSLDVFKDLIATASTHIVE